MISEQTIITALHRRYNTQSTGAYRYATAEHVPNSSFGGSAIADFLAVDCWRGRDQFPLLGFEIKVSRSDWLRELKEPHKAWAWSRYCTRWYLVAPADVVRSDLPANWGYIAVGGRGGLTTMAAAPKLHPESMPWQTSVALIRAVQKSALRRAAPVVRTGGWRDRITLDPAQDAG